MPDDGTGQTVGTRPRKSLWPAEGRSVAQFLWPGAFVVPKCSRCTVATLFLDQTTQANTYHIFWALNPWTSHGPSLGKCPNCTHLTCTHILTNTNVRVHTRLCKCIHGFPGPCPRFSAKERCPSYYLVTSPTAQTCPYTSLPRGHILPRTEPAGLCLCKAATDPTPAA